MKFVVKKIPPIALAFYAIGFSTISVALFNYLGEKNWFDSVASQQIFIFGGILVAVGSVINTLFQFKK